jgi:hypothetical protein
VIRALVTLCVLSACIGDTKPTTAETGAGGCGDAYGTDQDGCPLFCGADEYCGTCLAAPDTSDTATSSVVWACIPCGAAC